MLTKFHTCRPAEGASVDSTSTGCTTTRVDLEIDEKNKINKTKIKNNKMGTEFWPKSKYNKNNK